MMSFLMKTLLLSLCLVAPLQAAEDEQHTTGRPVNGGGIFDESGTFAQNLRRRLAQQAEEDRIQRQQAAKDAREQSEEGVDEGSAGGHGNDQRRRSRAIPVFRALVMGPGGPGLITFTAVPLQRPRCPDRGHPMIIKREQS